MAVFTSMYDPMNKDKEKLMNENEELLKDMLDFAIQELQDNEIELIDQMKACDDYQSLKIEKLYHTFNLKKDTEAFIPRMERYIRSKDKIVIQNMFPGYLFIKTTMNQTEFDTLLLLMKEERDGVIRELKKEEVSALTKEEIKLLDILLNKQYILVMSKGYKINGRTKIIEGPLKKLEEHIVSVDKKSHEAVLNIEFLNKKLKAGIEMQNKEV